MLKIKKPQFTCNRKGLQRVELVSRSSMLSAFFCGPKRTLKRRVPCVKNPFAMCLSS